MALPFCRKRSQSYFVDKKAGSLQNGPLWPPREWQGGYVSLQSHLSNIANIKEPLAWDPEWMDPTLNQSYFLIATFLIFHHIQRTCRWPRWVWASLPCWASAALPAERRCRVAWFPYLLCFLGQRFYGMSVRDSQWWDLHVHNIPILFAFLMGVVWERGSHDPASLKVLPTDAFDER